MINTYIMVEVVSVFLKRFRCNQFVLLFSLLVGTFSCLFAQSPKTAHSGIQPLEIGEFIPEEVWHYPVKVSSNSSDEKVARLIDYRGKLIILDFLNVGCVGCIEALPELARVQKHFGDQIVILPVTFEKQKKVNKFVKTNKLAKEASLPFLMEDTILRQYFPHYYISHMVWIDMTGKVRAFTGSNHVTKRTVNQILNKKEIDWPKKTETTSFFNDFLFGLNEKSMEMKENKERSIFYSAITTYTAGSSGGTISKIDSVNNLQFISMRNWSILDFYLLALQRRFKLNPYQIILEVEEPIRYDKNLIDNEKMTRDEWDRKYSMCYERTQPLGISPTDAYELMHKDLNRYLNLNGRLEIRDTICWILTKREKVSKDLRYRGELKDRMNTLMDGTQTNIFKGWSITSLVNTLNHKKSYRPMIVDETGYSKLLINLRLDGVDFNDFTSLKKALNPYGLVLEEARRKVEYFILTELEVNQTVN